MRASPFASPARRPSWTNAGEEGGQRKPRRPSACDSMPGAKASSPRPGLSHRRSISTSALLPGAEASLVNWGKELEGLQGFARMVGNEIALESALHTTVLQAGQCYNQFGGLATVQAPDLQPSPLADAVSSLPAGGNGSASGPALGRVTSLEKSIAACMLSPDAPDRVQRRVRITSELAPLSSAVQQQQQQKEQAEAQTSRLQQAPAVADGKAKDTGSTAKGTVSTSAVGQRSSANMRRSASNTGGADEPDVADSDADLPPPLCEPAATPSTRPGRRNGGKQAPQGGGRGSQGSPLAVLEGLLGRPLHAMAAILASHLPKANQQREQPLAMTADARRSRDVTSLQSPGSVGSVGSTQGRRLSSKFSDADVVLLSPSSSGAVPAAAVSG